MHSPDSKTAKERLALWLYHAENSHIPEFEAYIKNMHNWSEYIYSHCFISRSRSALKAYNMTARPASAQSRITRKYLCNSPLHILGKLT